jgi:hypothetical protein
MMLKPTARGMDVIFNTSCKSRPAGVVSALGVDTPINRRSCQSLHVGWLRTTRGRSSHMKMNETIPALRAAICPG